MLGNSEPHQKLILSEIAPKKILVIGIILIALAGILSPQLMIKLGPMRTSLLSENVLVRHIAEQEILFFRVFLVLAGVTAITIWIKWRTIIYSGFVRYILDRQPAALPDKNLFNPAFAIVGGGALLVLLWIVASGYIPGLMSDSIVREDGLIEYATAFVFLAAAIISFDLYIKLPVKKRRVAYILLAIGFFLCFGEEISWGQRIFDFNTPEALQSINVQNETNIHNSFGYLADHIFIAGVIVYGTIIPLLVQKIPFIHRVFDISGLPVASVGLAAGFFLVSLLHDWTVYVLFPRTPLRVAEARELLSSLGFLMLMIETRRYLR